MWYKRLDCESHVAYLNERYLIEGLRDYRGQPEREIDEWMLTDKLQPRSRPTYLASLSEAIETAEQRHNQRG